MLKWVDDQRSMTKEILYREHRGRQTALLMDLAARLRSPVAAATHWRMCHLMLVAASLTTSQRLYSRSGLLIPTSFLVMVEPKYSSQASKPSSVLFFKRQLRMSMRTWCSVTHSLMPVLPLQALGLRL